MKSIWTMVGCTMAMALSLSQSFAQNSATSAPGATAPARTMRIGIGLSAEHPQGQAAQFFARRIAERTKGQWRVTVHAGGSIGNDVTMTGDLQSGKLEFSAPDTSTLSRFTPGFSLINLPFEFTSELDAARTLDGRFGDALLSTLDAQGLVGLGYWENGFRHVTNSKRPLRAAADFRDLRVRVMQNPVFIDAFQGLGATTVPLPFPELFAALRAQGVDAQENPPITILAERFYEVQRYMTLTGHSYSAWVLLMSKKVWDTLSEAERQMVREVAMETRTFQRELIRAESKNAIETLKRKGMEVTDLSRVEASRVRMLVAERVDKHKAKIDRKWRDLLYLERLNDVLDNMAAKNGAAGAQTAAANTPAAAVSQRK